MATVAEVLAVGPVPAKYDKVYRVRGAGDTFVQVNPAKLECSCDDFAQHRASIGPDARRVCDHLCGKIDDAWLTPTGRLFVRYGRTMSDCELLESPSLALVLGRQRGRRTLRAIGEVDGIPRIITYDPKHDSWGSTLHGDEPDSPELADALRAAFRAWYPDAFQWDAR